MTGLSTQLNEQKETGKEEFDYHDFALVNSSLAAEQGMATAAGPGGDPAFPVKLHYVLSELKREGLDNIVSWQPHGRCFLVHDSKQFAALVLPNYFRQSKYSSFRRQLNLYGFKRLTTGQDKNGYYHERFLRGKPDLAHKVLRTIIKNKGPRRAASPSTEPNLYAYSSLPDADTEQHKNHRQESFNAQESTCTNVTEQSIHFGSPMGPARGFTDMLLAQTLATRSPAQVVSPMDLYSQNMSPSLASYWATPLQPPLTDSNRRHPLLWLAPKATLTG